MSDTEKEALDKVARLIDVPVKGARLSAVRARGNAGVCTMGREGVDQGLGVVGLVVMNEDHRTVEVDFLEIGTRPGQRGEDPPSHAALLPAIKPLTDAVPWTEPH